MYMKVENIKPKTRFLTPKGWRSPKEVWINTESGFKFRGMTKKSVIEHEEMMAKLGITPDMTDEEAIQHLKKNQEKIG